MKTKKLLLILSLIVGLNIFGQVIPNKDLVVQALGPTGLDVTGLATAIDYTTGAVYTCGYVNTVSSGKDLILVKLDSNLVQQWVATYDFTGLDDKAGAVCVDGSGNVYVTGGSFQGSGNSDIVTIKYNSSGTQQWVSRVNGTNNTNDAGLSILFDGTNVWVTGYVTTASKGKDAVILKLNGSSGATIASPKRNGTANGDDIGEKICSDGTSVFVTGTTKNTTTNGDVFVACVNMSSATLTWSISVNGSANADESGLDCKIDNGELYVCGYTNNTTTGSDYYFARINKSNGTIKYSNTYDGGYNGSDLASAFVPDKLGKYAVTGYITNGSNNEYHTRLYDTSSVLWTHVQPLNGAYTTTYPQIALDTIAQHFYICGTYSNSTLDGLLYQLDPTGTKRWTQYHNGTDGARDIFTDIVVDGLARVFVCSPNETSTTNIYDYMVIRYSQTPVYFVPNYNMAADTFNFNHLYYPNAGEIIDSSRTPVPEVLYYTRLSQMSEFIQKNKVSFCNYKLDTAHVSPSDSISKVDMYFYGANEFSEIFPQYFQETAKLNYFMDYLDSTGITDVKGAANLIVPNIYPMIDLHYSSNAKGAKYSFVVKPTGDPSDIKLLFDGAVSTATVSGGLRITTGFGITLTFKKPDIYNVSVPSWTNLTISTTTVTGTNGWEDLGGDTYRINPGTYDASKPLVIEFDLGKSSAAAASAIANIDYSTYVGGTTSDDIFRDIAVGSNGARFVIGDASTGAFPAPTGIMSYKGDLDVVVLGYTPGDTLIFATFWGGSSRDLGNTIAVNSSNEIFIGGQTSSMDFPKTNNAGQSNQTTNGYSSTLGYYEDGFLAKLTPLGNAYYWSRYYGGGRQDVINSIHVDASGNLHFAGEAYSTDIVMVNAAQSSVGTWQTTVNSEAIVGKFNTSLQIVYTTYLGGVYSPIPSTTRDVGKDITTDDNGKALVVGWTDSSTFPFGNSTGNSNTFYDNTLGGYRDGFIVRYSTTGAKEFASYFGGNGVDELSNITFNSLKNEIYIGGTAGDTTNYPYLTLAGAFNKRKKVTNGVATIASMDNTLTKQWCTNWGNAQTYSVTGLSTDNSGLIYLCGYTNDPTLDKPTSWPTGTVYKDTVLNGSYDGFVAVFAPVKSLYHAHYFGGAADDKLNSSDISLSSKLYVVGKTTSSDFPIVYNLLNINYIDSTYNGASDGFISRFVLSDLQIISVHELSFNNIGVLIYPNPTENSFNIEIDKLPLQKTQVNVFNMMGQLIDKKSVAEKTTRINCESWANGVYLINISDGSNSKTVKLIKN